MAFLPRDFLKSYAWSMILSENRYPLFGIMLDLLFGGLLGRSAASHGARAGGDRLDDVVVAGAAAEIAVELVADRFLVELVPLAAHDIERRHDHAGGAEAALQAMVLAKRLLHRMQLVAGRHPFDGQHIGAVE